MNEDPVFELGEIYNYTEGIIHVVVRVLSFKEIDEFHKYIIDPIFVESPEFLKGKMTKPFEIGYKKGYYGYCWHLSK